MSQRALMGGATTTIIHNTITMKTTNKSGPTKKTRAEIVPALGPVHTITNTTATDHGHGGALPVTAKSEGGKDHAPDHRVDASLCRNKSLLP